jgi:hypothetical protein
MISDVEFVAIKAFDRTLRKAADASTAIIDRKNSQLVAHGAEIVRLRAALAAETGARRLAQLNQITGARRVAELRARQY